MDNYEITYQLDLAAADFDRTTDTFNALLNGLDYEVNACVDAKVSAASLLDFTKIYFEGLSFICCHFRDIGRDFEALSEKILPSRGREVKESMDAAHEKGQITRERNLAAHTARLEEQTAAKRSARLALQRVTESPDSTPGELLKAAELLAELTR